MMSTSSPCTSSFSVLNAMESECAMVPRLRSSSSFVMPIPLSLTVTVRASLSKLTWMASSSLESSMDLSVRLLK